MNHPCNRRRFMQSALFGAGTLAAAPLWASDGAAFPKNASSTDRVELGTTGIKVSRIAMGTGFNGGGRESNQTRRGQEHFTGLMRAGVDNGLNFIDMADLYGTHTFVREALKGVPREDLVYLTKVWFMGGERMPNSGNAKEDVERFRKELGTDYIDVCLIHCLVEGGWKESLKKMRDDLSEYKEKGVIKAIGCSCHDFTALKEAVDDPWVDVIFSRINPEAKVMDVETPDEVPKVAALLKKARANGKAVVGMKIFGAGSLTGKEQREKSMHYAWHNNLIDAMTIGFEQPAQVQDTMEQLTGVLRA